jgi:hypothetical protein
MRHRIIHAYIRLMTIKEFIEKAIEGEWKPFKTIEVVGDGFWDKVDFQTFGYSHPSNADKVIASINMYRLILDPEAWKAVGKVEGWGTEPSGSIYQGEEKWFRHMHRMIDALAEGKTIEQFIATL